MHDDGYFEERVAAHYDERYAYLADSAVVGYVRNRAQSRSV